MRRGEGGFDLHFSDQVLCVYHTTVLTKVSRPFLKRFPMLKNSLLVHFLNLRTDELYCHAFITKPCDLKRSPSLTKGTRVIRDGFVFRGTTGRRRKRSKDLQNEVRSVSRRGERRRTQTGHAPSFKKPRSLIACRGLILGVSLEGPRARSLDSAIPRPIKKKKSFGQKTLFMITFSIQRNTFRVRL